MDLTLNKYDALILRLTTISPLVRHVVDTEQYRLRLETDDVDSEAVFQECIIALRDDLATLGLYLNCPLASLYEDFNTFNSILDTLEYVFPNTFYPKIQADASIRQAILDMLTGGVGDTLTIALFLQWLGVEESCYAPNTTLGAEWLLSNATSTDLFNTYLYKLLETSTTLDKAIMLGTDDLTPYISEAHKYADTIANALTQLKTLPDVESNLIRLQRRFYLFVNYLIQPENAALLSWLFMTNHQTLSDYLLQVFNRRWSEFRKSRNLYGDYYLANPDCPMTTLDLIGIAVRLHADMPNATRTDYLESLNSELNVANKPLTVTTRSLIVNITGILYPTNVV